MVEATAEIDIQNNQETKEHEPKNTKIILARGMEDLPSWLSGQVAKSLHAEAFDSNWKGPESFTEKLNRFENMVREVKADGSKVVVIGISAGGGLALSLMLEDPSLIDHLYSVSGCLDPNLNEPSKALNDLTEPNPSFKQMSQYLTEQLHPNPDEFSTPTSYDGVTEDSATGRIAEVVRQKKLLGKDYELIPEKIKNHGLADKITAYSSLGESDTIVDNYIRIPVWVKNPRYIGAHDHAIAIGKALVTDLRQDLSQEINS